MIEELEADVLIAGGGVGGLMAAVRAQLAGARVVVLGGTPGASNRISSLNATLGESPEDEPAGLFDDMLKAGGFINDPSVVAQIAHRSGPEIRFLAGLGVPFHRERDRFARRQAAGSSWTWAVYSLGMVGLDICELLTAHLRTARPAATFVTHGILLDLLLRDGEVAGGLAYNGDSWLAIHAPAVVLATGGAGQLFGNTTNPPGGLGIGYGLALEAGAALVDMEFVSFEPFIVAAPKQVRGRDLPTTVLREGARLRNRLGEEFLDTSSPSKDVICRAMVREIREGRGTPSGAVLYDIRGMAPELADRYVQIGQVLRTLKLRSSEAQLEVTPAQHFLMGGIRIDEHGRSNVPGLFAVGEVSGGAHGAHRLAACGGTEVVAMGAIAGDTAADYARRAGRVAYQHRVLARPELLPLTIEAPGQAELHRIRQSLDAGCGILRDRQGILDTIAVLDGIADVLRAQGNIRTFLGRSALLALAIAQSALLREESRGDHYRADYPARNDISWLGNMVVRLRAGEDRLDFSFEKLGLAGRGAASLPVSAVCGRAQES